MCSNVTHPPEDGHSRQAPEEAPDLIASYQGLKVRGLRVRCSNKGRRVFLAMSHDSVVWIPFGAQAWHKIDVSLGLPKVKRNILRALRRHCVT